MGLASDLHTSYSPTPSVDILFELLTWLQTFYKTEQSWTHTCIKCRQEQDRTAVENVTDRVLQHMLMWGWSLVPWECRHPRNSSTTIIHFYFPCTDPCECHEWACVWRIFKGTRVQKRTLFIPVWQWCVRNPSTIKHERCANCQQQPTGTAGYLNSSANTIC